MTERRRDVAAPIAGDAGFTDADGFGFEFAHSARLAKRGTARNGSEIVERNVPGPGIFARSLVGADIERRADWKSEYAGRRVYAETLGCSRQHSGWRAAQYKCMNAHGYTGTCNKDAVRTKRNIDALVIRAASGKACRFVAAAIGQDSAARSRSRAVWGNGNSTCGCSTNNVSEIEIVIDDKGQRANDGDFGGCDLCIGHYWCGDEGRSKRHAGTPNDPVSVFCPTHLMGAIRTMLRWV